MHIIHTPTITMLSRPKFSVPVHIPIHFIDDVSPQPDGGRLAEFAGRNCYQSWGNPGQKSTGTYLKHILEQRHGSVLEHANYTLLIEGVSRALTHELVRHRAGFAYSQLSQRYVDESDTAFVVPPAIIGDPLLENKWFDHMRRSVESYKLLVETLMGQYAHIDDRTHRRKVAREAARGVLPNSTETKIVVTANARAWRFFLGLRGSIAADREIRRLACKIADVLLAEDPAVFQGLRITTAPDGLPMVTDEFLKV